MRLRLLLLALFSTIVVLAVYYCSTDPARLVKYYGENLRGNLFAGFLTVGGFLFSLKTFIIIKMKENVYDHEKYKKRVEEQRELNHDITLYGPLKRLSHLLFVAVLASIVSAVLQLTVGLVDHWSAVLACLWSSVFAVSLLTDSLFIIKGNLDQWFEFLEQTKNT